MALKGTLRDFGIPEIFQLIAQQGKDGTLFVRHRAQEVRIDFQGKNVVRASIKGRDKRSLLGDMLLRAEVLSAEDLEAAAAKEKTSMKRLEEILLDDDMITPEVLKDFVRLQTTETVFKLFEWSAGRYEFVAQDVPDPNRTESPMSIESILMAGMQMIDEWPMIRNSIGSYGTTFRILRDLNGCAIGEDESDLPPVRGSPGLNERAVYALIRPDRDAQKIIDLSRLGEFETCKALARLCEIGLVIPGKLARHRRRQSLDSGALRSLGGAWARPATSFAMYAVMAALAWGLVVVTITVQNRPRDSDQYVPAERGFRDGLTSNQMLRITNALELYRLEQGVYPESLRDLVVQETLTELDMTYPWDSPYYYRRDSEAYVLLKPLY